MILEICTCWSWQSAAQFLFFRHQQLSDDGINPYPDTSNVRGPTLSVFLLISTMCMLILNRWFPACSNINNLHVDVFVINDLHLCKLHVHVDVFVINELHLCSEKTTSKHDYVLHHGTSKHMKRRLQICFKKRIDKKKDIVKIPANRVEIIVTKQCLLTFPKIFT